jgi:hypothetical protein
MAFVSIIALGAALVSVLTNSIAQTLLWTFVMVAGVMTAGIMYVTFGRLGQGSEALHVARGVSGAVAVLIAAAAVVVTQYLVRNRRRVVSVGIGVVAAGLLLQMTMTLWPSLWLPSETPSEIAPERAREIQVTFDEAHRFEGPKAANGRFDRAEMYYSVTGVPADMGFQGLWAEHEWQWGNLKQTRSSSISAHGVPRFLGLRHPGFAETEQWRQERARLFGWRYWPPNQRDGWALRSSARMRPSIAERMTKEPTAYRATLWLSLTRPTLEFEMPFAESNRRAAVGHSLRIVDIQLGKEVTFTAVETRPFLAAQFLRWALDRSLSFQQEPQFGYILANRERGEFIGVGGAGQTPTVPIYGVGVNPRGPTKLVEQVVRTGEWIRRPGWFEGATFGLVSMNEEARFRRDIRVEPFLAKGFSREENPAAPER